MPYSLLVHGPCGFLAGVLDLYKYDATIDSSHFKDNWFLAKQILDEILEDIDPIYWCFSPQHWGEFLYVIGFPFGAIVPQEMEILKYYSVQCSECSEGPKQLCKTLHCKARHCTALQVIARHCKALQGTARHCTALHCSALLCSALQGTARHCKALHCSITALKAASMHENECSFLWAALR